MYYISHHGIKGQRWGIRRYQNDDGTLTEKGKKHYGSDITKVYKHDLDKQMINYQQNYFGANGNSNKGHVKTVRDKRDKEFEDSDEFKNTNKLFDETDKAWTRYYKLENKLYDTNDVNLTQTLDKYLADAEDSDRRLSESLDAYEKKYSKVTEKYADEYRGAVLKDMGYEDTQAGRDFIKKNYKLTL